MPQPRERTTMTTPPAALTAEHPEPVGAQTLAAMRTARAHQLCRMAWKRLATGEPGQCRTLARHALRHTRLLAQHLRRARARSSPPPAWTRTTRQDVMLLRLELAELHAHFTHPTTFRKEHP